jgi:hypothetical protein
LLPNKNEGNIAASGFRATDPIYFENGDFPVIVNEDLYIEAITVVKSNREDGLREKGIVLNLFYSRYLP